MGLKGGWAKTQSVVTGQSERSGEGSCHVLCHAQSDIFFFVNKIYV